MEPLSDIIEKRNKFILSRVRALGCTQREVAKRVGVSSVYICLLLSGKKRASTQMLDKLLRVITKDSTHAE